MPPLLRATPPGATRASRALQGRHRRAGAAAVAGIGRPAAYRFISSTSRPNNNDASTNNTINAGNTTALPPHSQGRTNTVIPNPLVSPNPLVATTTTATSTPALTSQHRWSSTLAATDKPKMYTTSFAFFEALWDAGVEHVFVNLGSDHPSIIEAMVKGAREKKGQFPCIITCPNEMVAMSMADGYARLTNKPQAVIVHVDVGTQGLGAAVHNASAGRAPVLVFAGISPITQEGELRGSRTEFIHWIQDVPDQKQIVAQYCRYSAELKTGVNVKQMVNRALQFARSAPAGPVYLCGSREVMEMDIEPYQIKQDQWEPVELGGLPSGAVRKIADALAGAKEPLLVTGYAGRNQAMPAALVELANTVKGLRVMDTGGSDMCFPADHPAWLGLRYGVEDAVRTADVIVVLDCDVPWIQTQCKPKEDARIFHIDADPLKQVMPLFYIQAQHRYRADALTSVEQVMGLLKSDEGFRAQLTGEERENKWTALQSSYNKRLESIAVRSQPLENGEFGTSHLSAKLKDMCPKDTIWAVEAVTNTLFVHDSIQPTQPGQWINCGGGGLGWSGGGALGIKLASDHEAQLKGEKKGKFVVQIVGDGTFLFSVPGSVYWISKRYNIPVLTIVLNNKGWNAPRKSLLLVHPDGLGSKATNEEINISFDPVLPDYAGIAKAAAGGDLFTARVDKAADLDKVLKEAIEAVQGGQTAVVDCKVVSGC
ncbi:thiamine pyrophosphate enzyme, N-terminal TPP binding domain-containing protein [Chaetomidium leptoderma]|uniref:Thiamine pyrophosphate enzyme, N-terminal TPP binding domain-containing protein n=1 Tax=Chaetomidium leptoderma TaxID=669021 RepID=A0AAN6VHF6_9PEZI|nr:thiamine pyrophosphate enzyme, N-terminal TPP binding domain-containing protein [Chaetomidium leptoderma]